MATLVLQTAGAAIGGMFGPVGSVVGRALGGLAGAAIDNAFLAPGRPQTPLRNIDVMASTEGTPIARVFGRARVPGQIIWTTRVEAVRTEQRGGGKGGSRASTGETTSYFANVALAVCEGPISRIGRIWADNKPLDAGAFTIRVHTGSEDQEPDPLIVAKEGAENAPAYRGVAYVVFERMPLDAFGNRVPQLSFEVVKPVGRLERDVRAVTIIPGATEFGYDTVRVRRVLGIADSVPENQHTSSGETDFVTSLDELQAVCPNLKHVSLVIAWFGDDLRCGTCTVRPKVDSAIKKTAGAEWRAAGLTRASAQVTSIHDGRPAYGGSPSDASIIRAIQDLKARGLGVTLYPFLMMDIPPDNDRPDPVSGHVPQPAFPWRGNIRASGDETTGAAGEVAHFFGLAKAGDFSIANGQINYRGPGEWSWRRFVLHVANLGMAAGGVDAVIVGSEFRDLTRTRDDGGDYPATEELISLAGEVRAAVGGVTKITYAADWTEYGAHIPDGGDEVRFPLDPLWADPNMDAVAIDFYPPLADWRDGAAHLDLGIATSTYDRGYLAANVTGGEAHDWYYASETDRAGQIRTPITDGLGRPWIYRAKDVRSWWSQPHYERTDGAEHSVPTAWVPQSKPIWLTEIGCPAVDKGANAPNVFPDPKSDAAALPPFSSGERDDLIQRRTLEAILDVYGEESTTNPAATLYDGRMVDPDRTALWTWDARPFPVFPLAQDAWADGGAHETGHWLTGRLGQTTLAELASAVIHASGAEADTSAVEGVIDGYVIDRPATAREALEPLADLFGFGVRERDGTIVLAPRGRGDVRALTDDDLAADGDFAAASFTRAQESELPRDIAVSYSDPSFDFQPRIAATRMGGGEGGGVLTLDTAIVAPPPEMKRRAEIRLQDVWIGRETAGFALARTDIEPEPGDVIALAAGENMRLFEIADIAEGSLRRISARAILPGMLSAPRLPAGEIVPNTPAMAGFPEVRVLDIAWPDGEPPILSRIAVAARPWPGSVVAWKEAGGSYQPAVRVDAPAILGETLDVLMPGPSWRFDRAATVTVAISDGELSSATDERLYAGANLCALRNPDGAWEVLQFGRAELVAPATYRLSHFLRGQLGTEAEAKVAKPAGTDFVLLNSAVVPLVRGIEALGRPVAWRCAAAGRDHADPFAVAFSSTSSEVALRPLAPVHVRARRTEEGVAISWIRRDRIGNDSWDIAEIPMSEAVETYRVCVVDGAEIVRTMEASSTNVLYSSADEIADFGAQQDVLAVRIAQISAVTGPGRSIEVMLNV